jgi:catechol 2,3-dioxygenase-like lactoylglutathione lyase family enzyme
MFRNTKAFSGFSVDDLSAARHFYGEILGIHFSEETDMPVLDLHIAGGSHVMIYEKPNHVPATFTILNFPVPSIDDAVRDLKKLGVVFESYDLPGLKTDETNVVRGQGPSIAWFKDPAGNILSVLEL